MPEKKRQWFRLIGGWALIAAGIAGCLLPIAPGIPFIFAGLALLSTEYTWARKASDWLREKLSQLKKQWHQWRKR